MLRPTVLGWQGAHHQESQGHTHLSVAPLPQNIVRLISEYVDHEKVLYFYTNNLLIVKLQIL